MRKCGILLVLFAAAGPGEAQSWPDLPPQPPTEREVIDQRLQVLCPQIIAARAKVYEAKEQNDWFDRLVLERISGNYSVGEGLSVVDQTNATGNSTVLSQQDNEAWAVTYTIPLSLFRAKRSTDAHADRDLQVLAATQKITVLGEVEALRDLLLDLRSSRWLFESECEELKKNKACIGYYFSAWKGYRKLMSRLNGGNAGDCQIPADLTRTVEMQNLTSYSE